MSDSLQSHGQSVEFSRPEYWSGLPFPSPGDLPNPGIEPRSPTLQVDSLPTEPPGNPSTLWRTLKVGNFCSNFVWNSKWKFLKKLKVELPYDAAIPLLGIYPEKPITQKNACPPVFTAALFTICRTGKQTKCPLTE